MNPSAFRTTEMEVSGADEMEQFLVDVYGASMRIRPGAGRQLLRHRRANAGLIAIETAYQSADLEFEVEPLRNIVITRTLTSRLERGSDSSHRRYGAGELFVMSYPDLPYTGRWTAGEIENTIISPALLDRVAALASATRPQPVRLVGLDPRSPQAAARWRATRAFVANTMAETAAANSPLLIGTAANILAAATLATFPNTSVTDPTVKDRHDAHPGALRRAIAFIDDNAHIDISLADIAAAACVSVRAVQLAFRRHLDMTPMKYLRHVRLDHAHRELLASDPARQTVTNVAYRWGFPSPSRFSAYYRRAYGVSPSQTLRDR